MTDDVEVYLSGSKLYGDDFSLSDLEAWVDSEREAYANRGAAERAQRAPGHYSYHALNWHTLFRHISHDVEGLALGIGSGDGEEFLPIADRLQSITIVEPSHLTRRARIGRLAPTYVDPSVSGDMPFCDEQFDLVISLTALMHIPNVSKVVAEMARVVRRGGTVCIRDTIVSMGDWQGWPENPTHPRGIPRHLLKKAITATGMTIQHEGLCVFPLLPLLCRRVNGSPGYNSKALVRIDAGLARLFAPNYRYYARTPWQRLRPVQAFYIARK